MEKQKKTMETNNQPNQQLKEFVTALEASQKQNKALEDRYNQILNELIEMKVEITKLTEAII